MRESNRVCDIRTRVQVANKLAFVLQQRGNHGAAERLCRDTLKSSKMLLGAEHPDTLKCAVGLASVLTASANYEAAEELSWGAMKTYENIMGRNHLDTLECMNVIASIYRHQERWDEWEQLRSRGERDLLG